MATQPPNYTPGGPGALVTSRYDFQNHVTGMAFRHTADQIDLGSNDMPAPIYINGIPYYNVETVLTAIASNLITTSSAEVGFLTVLDGYDTYHAPTDTVYFDHTIPSLDTFLNPLFAALNSGTGIPIEYTGLTDGGILVIPEGTYIVKNTINVPPGITLMGKGFGTKIVNATALNTSVAPPYPVTGTPAPVFKILADNTTVPHPVQSARAYIDGAIDANMFMFCRETRIWNMVICDNFVEPPVPYDSNYKLPQNTSSTVPLILQEAGSNLTLSNVSMLGRVNVPSITSSAVRLDTMYAAPTGSILTVDKCFMDGFSVPVQWLSTGDTSDSPNVNKDFLVVTDSKIRAYGYLTTDGSSPINNSVIVANDNNTLIANNYIYGNGANIASLLYLNAHIAGTPNYGARSKITVQGNSIEVNRSSTSPNTTFAVFLLNSSNYAAPSTYINSSVANNSFQSTVVVATSTYTVGPNDHLVIAPTATGAVIINLPSVLASLGREIIIKDPGYASLTHSITINANGSDVFDGVGSSYVVTTPGTSLTLVAYTYNSLNSWFII